MATSPFRRFGAKLLADGFLAKGLTTGFGFKAGYGVGGTVTQATSITTGVTLNKLCGTITTVSSTLAAAAEVAFVVTNSKVAATDLVVVNIKSTASAGTPVAFVTAVAAGSFTITLSNLHASAALDNTVVLSFTVIKAVAD